MKTRDIIFGLGIAGIIALGSCVNEETTLEDMSKNKIEQLTPQQLADIEKTSNYEKILGTIRDKYQLNINDQVKLVAKKIETQKQWNNAKATAECDYNIFNGGDSSYDSPLKVYKFTNPNNEEILLLSEQGTIFMGDNYQIDFLKLKEGEEITYTEGSRIFYNNLASSGNKIIKDVDGLLLDYKPIKRD